MSLFCCLIISAALSTHVNAVTDTELEALEKQIQQQEDEAKRKADAETRHQEEARQRDEIKLRKKAEEEKLQREREQQQIELERQRAIEERKRLQEEKTNAEESRLAEDEKIKRENEITHQAKLESLRKQEELHKKLISNGRDLALVQEGATLMIPVDQDPSSSQNAAIDGISNDYGIWHGWSASSWKKPGSFLLVNLKEMSLVNRIKFLLWDKDGRYYHYRVETSTDQINWDTVSEKNTGEWRGWQEIAFKPKEVRYVKITGLYNSSLLFLSENPWFHVVEIEVMGLPLSEIN